MIQQLGLQLYTCRDLFTDEAAADETLGKIRAAGYTEAHTAGRYGLTPEKFAELCHKNDIRIIGTHYNLDKILNDQEETIEIHKLYGTTNIGIGSLPMPARTDLNELKSFIEKYNKSAEFYAKKGFKLTYHNHQFEFMRIDGKKTIMDYLCEGLNPESISFVLDTCWVMAGCNDVCRWMEKLAGRIDILHCKDVMLSNDTVYCGTMTEVGNGFVCWDKVIELAEEIGVKHYAVEQDNNFENGNALDSIKTSAEYLKRFM